jgi:hypothetical protein
MWNNVYLMKTIIIVHPITGKEIKIQSELDAIVGQSWQLEEETLLNDLNCKINKAKLNEKDKNSIRGLIIDINRVEHIEMRQEIGVLTQVVYLKTSEDLRKKIKCLFLKGGIKI